MPLTTSTSAQQLRPLTLAGPEREPVQFTVNLVGAPAEVEQLVQQIKTVAEQFLYHWKTFPIVLPQPLSAAALTLGGSGHNGSNTVGNRKTRPINLRDLFIAPPFDELDAVASDGTGEPRRLTNSQLKSLRENGLQKDKYGKPKKLTLEQLETIRKNGEFNVPSLHFPGQVHKWRLSQLLQKGTLRAQDSFLSDLALAARFLVITARGRIFSHFFSVCHAVHALLHGLVKVIDMFIGVPALLAHNLDYKIKEERCRFLIAELVCRPEFEDCLDGLCSYVRKMLRRATMEKFDFNSCESSQPVPYLFLTPKGQEIDLRLFCRDVMRKALPILIGILERETRGWFLHFRERLIGELRDKKLTDKEIEEEVNEAVMKEYLQRVYTSIMSNPKLAELGPGIPELLVQQAQAVVIMYKAVEKVQNDIKRSREDHQKCLANDHSVLSRVAPWLRARLRHAEENKLSKSSWSAHEEALKMCSKQNLHQTAYFLSRDLAFMKEREPVLLKELKNAKTPTRSFQWACRIWSPKSWIIKRNFQGQSDIIPTVISQQATSIVTPRSDPSQPVFLVEKEIIRTTSTRWPFWRLLNLMQRTWCWTWNMMFLLGILVPWCSPLSLRALFCVKPFMPDLELSQINGTLFPRKTSITQTMASRLIELWRHISKSRTHFETEPDTGFIGKGFTRNLNRVWNYFVKGFLGTVVILFAFPLLCLATSFLSIILALTAPFWIPIFTILLHIYMILIYDLDSPDNTRNRYCILLEALIWNILIQGCVQPIVAVFVASIVCPVVSSLILIVGVIRYSLRLLWDSLTFHLFIKKCGRIPASDSLVVKRIAGPGLALDYYFVIRPEQALAAFEAKMELDELQAYQHAMERIILTPQKDFSQFVEACFGPFSAQLSKSGPYLALDREAQDLTTTLHEKLEKRRRELQTSLTSQVKTRIKLNTKELKIAIQLAAHILEKYYPSHIIARLSITEDEFWDNKGLTVNDWPGLAGLIYTEIFSLDFLTPLLENDTHFKLEPHPTLDLTRYTEMVQNATDVIGSKGLDLLGNVYAPRGNVQVHLPFLEVTAFNPRSRITLTFRKPDKRDISVGLTTPRVRAHRAAQQTKTPETKKPWRPWKKKIDEKSVTEKLLIPLPVPHPVHIAISIYNRDAEHPIPLDSELVWEILKSIEDCQGGDVMEKLSHRAAQQTKTPETKKPWRPWKKKIDEKSVTEKLLIPLPVPHPVHIAISIYNRDAEHPIPLDSELVWEILKSIEDCQGGDVMEKLSHRAAQQTKTPETKKPWRPWKKKIDEKSVTEKLLIPLPVPHPVHIAISIYNRDAEHPIPLDSELVWEILKSIEDCQGGDVMEKLSHRAAQQTKTPETKKPWRPWKKKIDEKSVTEKLLIPLPVPHPVHIAISIYNRDAEHPIPLDSELVWEILKSIEDCQGGDVMAVAQSVAHYRGAVTESSNDSLASSSSIGSTRESASGTGSGSGIGNGTETLPCVNREVCTQVKVAEEQPPSSGFHWTLSNWGAAQTARRRTNSNVRVDLASPEDISLDTDSSRAVFNPYGTTV